MLRLDHVTAGYGDTTVLRDVTLAVPDASVVALLGANGAGKTTLLRVASGLLHPTHGTLSIDDRDVTGRTPHVLAGYGLCHIPEGRGVFPELSVRENLQLFAPPGAEKEQLLRVLDAFPQLERRLDSPAGTLSGGEQQMLALGRSYAARPSIVLLDEVSMGLAPLIVDEIFVFLARLASEGAALLLVEQYVSKALAVADYVYVLDRGAISFAGEACELESEDLFARYVGVI
jgi:branched-chain amino acid transport system ATP-binding protein